MIKKKNILAYLAILILAQSVWLTALPEPQETIEGIWVGVLKVSSIELRIVFKISKKADGSFTGTLDSPDQGAADIPTEEVTYTEGNVTIKCKTVAGVFEGTMKEGNQEIEGTWKQGGGSLPLTIKRTAEVPKVNRPQTPQKPFPYNEEEVMYENKKAGIQFAGTLTLPRSEGPFPAVILITGSGPQDRDETIFNHRPFLVIADYLTRNGIAVLRVDDRGMGGSTGKDTKPTSMDFADDVLAGVDFIKTRKEINPKQIGLIGHSEGGLIAPIVASKSDDIAFIVMMAGTGLNGEEILLLQSALIAKAGGTPQERIDRENKYQKQIYSILKENKDDVSAEKQIRAIFTTALAELTEQEKKEVGDVETYIKVSISQLLNPWMRFFLTFDPKTALVKVKCPVLAINGEKDLQVPPKENLAAIEQSFKSGGNKNYTLKEFPGLNHLFQKATTGAVSEYAKIEETISPDVLKLMGDWILALTKK